jgi:Fic family protein
MIDKLLRPFVADQLKALMEKLETQEIDARSLRKIGEVLSEMKLTRFERYVVGRVYKRVRRVSDMNRLMAEIIIGQPEMEHYTDTGAMLRNAVQAGLTGNAMWNGHVPPPPPPEQTKRVIVRPKVKAL